MKGGLAVLLAISLQLPVLGNGASCDSHSHFPHMGTEQHMPALTNFSTAQLAEEPESDSTITPVDQVQTLSNIQEINFRETEFSFPQFNQTGQPVIEGEQLVEEQLPDAGAMVKETPDSWDNDFPGLGNPNNEDVDEQPKNAGPEPGPKRENAAGEKRSAITSGQAMILSPVRVRVKAARPGERNLGVPASARNQIAKAQPVFQVVRDRAELTIITTVGQVITAGSGSKSDSLTLGAQGTAVTQTVGSTILHAGKLLTDTGNDPVVVQTRVGEVTIGGNSTVEIIDEPDKPVQIFCLRAKSVAVVKVAGRKGKPIELMPGQSLTLGDEQPPVEPSNNKTRGTADEAGAEIETQRKSFSVAGLLNSEELLSRRALRLSGAKRASLDRMVGHLNEAAASQSPDFTLLKAPPSVTSGKNASSPARLLARQGTTFSEASDGALELASGTLFVVSEQPLLIRTELGQVRLREHALMLIAFRLGRLRIMSCSGPGSIIVESGHRKLDLAPGREVLIMTHRPSKPEALPSDGIGRRHLAAYALEGKLSLVCGDFSITSMLRSMNFLAAVAHPTTDTNKQSFKRLLKIAASVQIATAGHGPYFLKPRLQASSIGAAN
jgi:hypothetical protein